MTRSIVMAGMAAVILGCGGAGESANSAPEDEASRRAAEAELIAADRELARQVQRSGLAAFIAGFTVDGRLISGGESHIGPEGIRRAMLPLFADSAFSLRWDPVFARIAESGELGYTVGTYEMSGAAEAGGEAHRGSYLSVWRKRDDGSWRLEADIGNAAPTPVP